jgi:hypothetical protein
MTRSVVVDSVPRMILDGIGSLICSPTFLSDNQQLVSFLNGADHSNPPMWNIKTFTQSFINNCSRCNGCIFKIDRKMNITAHLLAAQAYKLSPQKRPHLQVQCSNANHVNSCPVKTALQSVIGDLFTNIAARCC